VRKKLLFASVAILGFFFLLELLLAACGVRPRAESEDPYVGFSTYLPLFVEQADEQGRPWMTTAPNKRRWFNEQRFAKDKPTDAFRVFCLGGSTTFGRPYDDRTSFCGWLRELLPAADGSRGWEVINAGGISYASYRLARLMEELVHYEPDLFILYTGHNEFLEVRTYEHIRRMPSSVRGLGALASHTRTYAAVAWLVETARGGSAATPSADDRELLPAEVKTLLDQAVGPDAYRRDDALREKILSHYEYNLHRMIDIARRGGAAAILVAPASNLADCAPFKSEHAGELDPARITRFDQLFRQAGEAYSAGRLDEARQAVDQAAAIDERYADLLYLRGRVLLAEQRYAEAKTALVRARDEDVCPLRAPTEIRNIVLRVAARRNVPVVDLAGCLEQTEPHGIPGSDFFLDHVHPTVDGHRRLALLVLDELVACRTVTPDDSWGEAAIRAVAERIESRVDRRMQAKALRNLSKVLAWAGKVDEADRFALQAIQLVDDDAEAEYQAANALMRQGKVDEALARYQRALRLDPTSPLTHYGLALAWTEKGEPEKVAAHYGRAIDLDPDYSQAHYNLANLWFDQGELDRAAFHYREAARSNPRDADAYNNLGLVLARQGQIAEAKAQFEQAVRVNPRSADAHANLGRAVEELGDPTAAIGHYREALRHDSRQPFATARLGALVEKPD
jgi:tetratricopeptide (TPR) repeat protein